MERSVADPVYEPPKDEPDLLRSWWRSAVSVLMMASGAGAIVYQLLAYGQLKQTTALFVGLPMVLGLLTANLTRTKSMYGAVVRADVIFLAVVAPLLGEGSICVLMAAPLFIGASLVIAVLYRTIRNATLGLVVIPFALGIGDLADRDTTEPVTVTTTTIVEGDVDTWRARVRGPAPVVDASSMFLTLGFPLPTAYDQDGEHFEIRFEHDGASRGAWAGRTALTNDGVRFEIDDDDSKIGTWMSVLDSEVHVDVDDEGRVVLEHTTRFVPILTPHWYFVPMQAHAVESAHELAVDSWR